MFRKQNLLGIWIGFVFLTQLPPLQSINEEIRNSRKDNLWDRNASFISPNKWIPLQQTSAWKSDENKLPVLSLSNSLIKFADLELGLTGVKNSYESLRIPGLKKVKSVVEETEDIATRLSGQIISFQDALDRLAAAIKSSTEGLTPSFNEFPYCCQMSEESFQFDEYFESSISKRSGCLLMPQKLKSSSFIPGQKLNQALLDNSAQFPYLKWQYFISPEGVHVEYPANNQNCKNSTQGRQATYNPRGHPERKLWLIQKSKDDTRMHRVVFVIHIGSDSNPSMVKAVRTIVTLLLRFLDNTDEVGIISSDHEENFLCEQMVPVTPWTRFQIMSYLNYIERRAKHLSQTDTPAKQVAENEVNEAVLIQDAINMACANLTDSPRFPPSAATIIHLSSGANFADFSNQLFHVNCPVFLETYFLKTPSPSEEDVYKRALESVASKNIWRVLLYFMSRTEPETFAVKVALKLSSKKEWWSLSDILGQFFPAENTNSSQMYDFSFPHWNPDSMQTVIVAKKYIFHVGQPLGLVAIEIPLMEFTQHINYFVSDNLGDSSSYAFLIDTFGRVIAHPALGKSGTSEELPQIQIDQIEVHSGFIPLKRRILSQIRGCHSLKLRNQKAWITYTWTKVEPNYVVVLSFLKSNSGCSSDKSGFNLRKDSLNPKSGVQHHLLLQTNFCCYKQPISLKKAGLYLAPNAFLRPTDMLNSAYVNLKPKLPLALMAYIGDNSGLLRNPKRGIRTEIKDHISALANSVPDWRRRFLLSESSKYILRRFASGAGGTFLLTYPGFTVSPGYVPRATSWYRKAVDEPGKLVFLAPTLDPLSKLPYTTMSHDVTTQVGGLPFTPEKQASTIAILGADMSILFLEKLLEDLIPECKRRFTYYNLDGKNITVSVRCFLLDEEGFVIYHPHLTRQLKLLPRTHVTQLEPLSVIDVLQHGQDNQGTIPLQKRMCRKVGESAVSQNILRRVYNLAIDSDGLSNLKHGELCSRYLIMPVPRTNLFLSVVQDACTSSTAFCPCSTIDNLCLNCLRMETTDCECPCECPREPSVCTSKGFPELSNDVDICAFPSESLPMVKPDNRRCDIDINLHSDFELLNDTCRGLHNSCPSFGKPDECLSAWDCDWCRSRGTPSTSDSYCMSFSLCNGYNSDNAARVNYRGNASFPNNNLPNDEDIEADNQITVVPIVAVLSLFLVFIALVFYCYRYRALTTSSSQPDLHLLPLHESPMGSVVPQAGSSRSDSDTDPDYVPQQIGVEDRNNRRVHGHAFPPRSPLGSVFGTDSDLGYSTMTPNEDSECGASSRPVIYIDNPSQRLLDTGVVLSTQCQNIRKSVSSRSHSLLC